MKFGTLLVDPPWAYQKTTRHKKLSGYSDVEYSPLSTADLAALPVGKLGSDESVLLLWTTFPFVRDALSLVDAWDYKYVTAVPWIKTESHNIEKVSYGVGYWFRGAAELILVGKRSAAFRTNFVGLLTDESVGLVTPGLNHSRKPECVYSMAEKFPGPRLEIFARKQEPGWYAIGDEAPGDGGDIRRTLTALLDGSKDWKDVYEEKL